MMSISVEDRLEIQAVIVQLYEALDQQDGKHYASFFMPDGILENQSFGVVRGREAIAQFIQKHCDEGHENGALHCISNVLIWEDDNAEASLRAEVMKFRVIPN